MTPSQMDLWDRAHELRQALDEQDETEGLSPLGRRMQTFLSDVIEEMESC